MVIKNKTIFDGQEVKETILKDNKITFFKKVLITFSFLILGIFITIFSVKEDSETLYLTFGIGLILFSVLSFSYNLVKYLKMKKKVDIDFKYEITHGIIYDYSFHEEKFKLTIKVGDRTSKMEAFYKGLKKIINYDNEIVFVVSSGNSYKCKKCGFVDKKQEELFFYGLSKHDIKVKNKIQNK